MGRTSVSWVISEMTRIDKPSEDRNLADGLISTVIARAPDPWMTRVVDPRMARAVDPSQNRAVDLRMTRAVYPRMARAVDSSQKRAVDPRMTRDVGPWMSRAVYPRMTGDVDPRMTRMKNGHKQGSSCELLFGVPFQHVSEGPEIWKRHHNIAEV
jgi:hypothetical protein